MSTDGDVIPDNIYYVEGQELPEPDTYVQLASPDGKMVETYCYGHHCYGFYNGVAQMGGEYGPEAIQHVANHTQYRLSQKFDCVFMITGDERVGKSNFAIQLALAIDPNFSLDNIVFKIKDFNDRIAQAKPGEVIIMDEAGVDLNSQEWYAQFQKVLGKKLQVIGKKQIVLILVLPHKDILNSGIRERRIKYWVDVSTRGSRLERGYCEITEGFHSKWERTTFWAPFVSCKYPELKGKFWDDYETLKKDPFIEEISGDAYEPEEGMGSKSIQARNTMIAMVLDKGIITQTDLAKEIGLPQPYISRVYAQVKEQKKLKEKM